MVSGLSHKRSDLVAVLPQLASYSRTLSFWEAAGSGPRFARATDGSGYPVTVAVG